MDTLDSKNISNRTKIILTNILHNFLKKYKNDHRFSQHIINESNKHLKTQLFIIFEDSNLFDKSMNYLNITNTKLVKYLHNIRTFFENNNYEKQKKGIDFILNKSGLNDQYNDIIQLLDEYEKLYDNIRYNEKIIEFIYKTFTEEFKYQIESIITSLNEFDSLYKKFDIHDIEEKINIIKQFYETNDKEIFIMSQKSIMENKITNFLINITKFDKEFEIDFNFAEFKPSDISIMTTNDLSAEEIWNELISEQKQLVYDRNPRKYFIHFLELFNYFKKIEKKFNLDSDSIKILIVQINNYNIFLQEEKKILNNIEYYINKDNKNEDEDTDTDNFIKFLNNIPKDAKNLLNKIKTIISTIISSLFLNMNLNYNIGFETNTFSDSINTIENDLFKIQYYDKNIAKQRVSYNVLLIYANKCAQILSHKKDVIEYQNILPIGLYPTSAYKYNIELYVYILTKIYSYIITKLTDNELCIGENCRESIILILSYYKILRNLKYTLNNLPKDYPQLIELIDREQLNNYNLQMYLDSRIKATSTINSVVENIIYNMNYYELPTRNNALNKKIKQKNIKLIHKQNLKDCIEKNNKKLRNIYLNKKPSNSKLVQKLLSNEKYDDKEWNVMMNSNYQIFIAYFSNMFQKIKLDFSDANNELYSFENFNNINVCQNKLTEYKNCYELNYNKWVSKISNLLPLHNYIERYINVYEQYIENDLYKIIDNRIILLNTKDELKYYKTLKTKTEQNKFIELVLEKQNVVTLSSQVTSFFNFYKNEKKFYDNLFNICLSNEDVFEIITKHISELQSQINTEQENIDALQNLAEELDDDEMLKNNENKKNLLETKKHFLKLIVSKKFEDKFEISQEKTDSEMNVELVKTEINIKENEIDYDKDDEDDEGDEGEYGETEEPNEIDNADIYSNVYEFNDFEQQTQINIQDILDKQDKNKKELLKQWANTLFMYLDIPDRKNIMDKVLNLIDNIKYKNSNQKKIHTQFAKFLKNEYLSMNNFNDIKKIKFDKKLRKMHYEFLNQVEYDVFRLLLILYTITYNLDNIVKQKIDICSTQRIKNFIKEQYNVENKTNLSNFVTIINGKWKGFTATIVSNSNQDEIIDLKKIIINNLKSCLLYYKKMKKTFISENWLSKFEKLGNNNIINSKKTNNQEIFLNLKISQFTQQLDNSIKNIKQILLEKINNFKNNYIYVTIDRYGINGNKYVPHIKQIKLKLKDVEFSKLSTKGLNISVKHKFEEVKKQFSNVKGLSNYVKCLYYILEIFHNRSSKIDFEEIFEKNYFIYIYNFAFEIYLNARAVEKRSIIIQLENEFDIDSLKLKLNTGILSNIMKRRLQRQITIAETKERILNIEDKYDYLFDTFDDKKTRKDTVSLFKNLYVNNKGNILPEYEISVMKQISNKKTKIKNKLIKKLNNQFDSFLDKIEDAYEQEECNIFEVLNKI